MNAEKVRFGLRQSQHAGRAAEPAIEVLLVSSFWGGFFRFFENAKLDQFVRDLARSGLAEAERLGEVSAGGGAEPVQTIEQGTFIVPAHTARDDYHTYLINFTN
jgi:hypothetical protein